MVKRQKITITGCVQGVGFRPAVYRIACQLGLSGFVYNDTKGATIELQGSQDNINTFLQCLQFEDKPPLAQIASCEAVDILAIEDEDEFTIKQSGSVGTALSQVTGLSYTEIAVGYVLSHSFPSIAVVGSHTTAQIEDVMTAADVRLSPDQMNQLEAV